MKKWLTLIVTSVVFAGAIAIAIPSNHTEKLAVDPGPEPMGISVTTIV